MPWRQAACGPAATLRCESCSALQRRVMVMGLAAGSLPAPGLGPQPPQSLQADAQEGAFPSSGRIAASRFLKAPGIKYQPA